MRIFPSRNALPTDGLDAHKADITSPLLDDDEDDDSNSMGSLFEHELLARRHATDSTHGASTQLDAATWAFVRFAREHGYPSLSTNAKSRVQPKQTASQSQRETPPTPFAAGRASVRSGRCTSGLRRFYPLRWTPALCGV